MPFVKQARPLSTAHTLQGWRGAQRYNCIATSNNFSFISPKEENRNLCEDEPDKAECIKEVEEVKRSLQSEEEQQGMWKITQCFVFYVSELDNV